MFSILLDPVGHEALALDETSGIHAGQEEATMPETLIELYHSSGFDLPALVRVNDRPLGEKYST
jgi:hypothetical protein